MLMKILGFDAYAVNERGEVFSQRGKMLCQWKDNMGYKQVVLYKEGKRYYKRVHRLVYEAFNGKIPDNLFINHIDSKKDNNDLSNLELMTNSENIKHFHQNNTQQKYNVSVYNKDTKDLINTYDSLRQLCEELSLNRKTVTSILNGTKKTNNYPYTFVNNTK
jgi:hypothetical protein